METLSTSEHSSTISSTKSNLFSKDGIVNAKLQSEHTVDGSPAARKPCRSKSPTLTKPNSATSGCGATRRPKSARITRRQASSIAPKEHRQRRPSTVKTRLSPPAHATRREKICAHVASLNKSFTIDFDYALLPKCAGSTSRLRLDFAVPKHKLVASGADSAPTRRVCFVSPAKLERAFQLSSLYVGKWGANPRGMEALADSRSRYKGVLKFLCAMKPILVSTVVLDGDTIRFVDGKHRFCVYRDLGLSCIPVLVPARERKIFRKRFRPSKAEKKIVKQCTKKVKQAHAKFDPKYNSWRSRDGASSNSPTTTPCRPSTCLLQNATDSVQVQDDNRCMVDDLLLPEDHADIALAELEVGLCL